jgi:UDP-glucose 4-epimerase
MEMISVLVTGGAGFIGSHLADALMASGRQVTVIDDLSTGRWSNIEHLANEEGFRAIVASVADPVLMEKEVQRHDVVYHLASAVGVKLVIEQPIKTVETIVRTTDVVMEACSKYRTPVVLTSTSETYGKSKGIPFKEDDDVVLGATSKRRWAYAAAKLLDEFLALAHHHETGLPVYIARLFNTVGPRQMSQYGMVVPTFVSQALQNQPITVFGDGTQQRCFTAVDDVIDALMRFPLTPAAQGQVVNIGANSEMSMMALAQLVKDTCDSQSEIVLVPYEKAYGTGFDDMARRIPDITRASELLGWQPTRSIESIVEEVVAGARQ